MDAEFVAERLITAWENSVRCLILTGGFGLIVESGDSLGVFLPQSISATARKGLEARAAERLVVKTQDGKNGNANLLGIHGRITLMLPTRSATIDHRSIALDPASITAVVCPWE